MHFTEVEGMKRPEGWRNKAWMLHHNAPAYTSFLVREFFAKHMTTVCLFNPATYSCNRLFTILGRIIMEIKVDLLPKSETVM
jgi:hypothetical protein